jgi:hypothetical protein
MCLLPDAPICLARFGSRGYSIPWTEPLVKDDNVFYNTDRTQADVNWGRVRNTRQVENGTSAVVELEIVTSMPQGLANGTQMYLNFFFGPNQEIPIRKNYTLYYDTVYLCHYKIIVR